MLLLCRNEQFVININPIRLLSSILLLISCYLPAPVVSLFIVSSPKLVSPCESSTAESFFSTFPEKSFRYFSKLQKLLLHHFTCTPTVQVKQLLLSLQPINILQRSGFGKSFIFHPLCIFTQTGEQNKLFSRVSE